MNFDYILSLLNSHIIKLFLCGAQSNSQSLHFAAKRANLLVFVCKLLSELLSRGSQLDLGDL